MADIRDVAQYILNKRGPMTTWKLQKLMYYCQAWSVVWDDKPLFPDQIEAWANGPVVRRLYDLHAGEFKIDSIKGGNPARLSDTQRETIDAVLKTYGPKTGTWLRELTHKEPPWRKAREREGLAEGVRGNAVIRLADLEEYYGGLTKRA